jgi:hypothetical protein
MTIGIPHDLAHGLEGIAAAQKKTVQQVAEERLSSLFDRASSPAAILRAEHDQRFDESGTANRELDDTAGSG